MNTRSTLDSAENWAEFVVNKLDMVRGFDRADETAKMRGFEKIAGSYLIGVYLLTEKTEK